LPVNRGIHIVPIRGDFLPLVAQHHQSRDAVFVVNDAFAPDFSRVCGKHGHDKAVRKQFPYFRQRHTLRRQPCAGFSHRRAVVMRKALSVLG
jgi:hypothetical protein